MRSRRTSPSTKSALSGSRLPVSSKYTWYVFFIHYPVQNRPVSAVPLFQHSREPPKVRISPGGSDAIPLNRLSVALPGIAWNRPPHAQLHAAFPPARSDDTIRDRWPP